MECRICQENDVESKLISPCKCSGSLRYVHKSCLITWIETSRSTHCGVCKAKYSCNLIIRRIPFLEFLKRENNRVMRFAGIFITFTAILLVVLITSILQLNRSFDRICQNNGQTGIGSNAFNTSGYHGLRYRRRPVSLRDVLFAKMAIVFIISLPIGFIWTLFFNEIMLLWDQYLEYDIED